MKKLVVALDGPAGAGKSTIAKAVAEKIGYAYIDTGAMYRAVTWKFAQTGHAYEEKFIGELSETMKIEFQQKNGRNCVFADGVEITDCIRTPEITKLVSPLSAIPQVRVAMVAQQRRMGETGGVILDGRDIGTVVFHRPKWFICSDQGRKYVFLRTKHEKCRQISIYLRCNRFFGQHGLECI